MDFLQLHIKGKPALFRVNSIEGVLPAQDAKGKYQKGSYIVSAMEGMSQHVDESFQDILDALTYYEVEIEAVEVANDQEEDDEIEGTEQSAAE